LTEENLKLRQGLLELRSALLQKDATILNLEAGGVAAENERLKRTHKLRDGSVLFLDQDTGEYFWRPQEA